MTLGDKGLERGEDRNMSDATDGDLQGSVLWLRGHTILTQSGLSSTPSSTASNCALKQATSPLGPAGFPICQWE